MSSALMAISFARSAILTSPGHTPRLSAKALTTGIIEHMHVLADDTHVHR
jgi:hypothetical protein